MTTGRKRWWRGVAIAAVGGGVVAGGWFGFVRATAQPDLPALPGTVWERTATPTPAPTIAEYRPLPEPAPATGAVTPVGALLPIPRVDSGPVVPAVPVASPVIVPPAPPGTFPVPPVGPGPNAPGAGPTGTDKCVLPAVPMVPSLAPAELPALPGAPNLPEQKPIALPVDVLPTPPAPAGGVGVPPLPVGPATALPPLQISTAEPPKAPPAAPPTGPVAPAGPAGPMIPTLPQPTEITLPPVPAKPADPAQPMIPGTPDYGLKPMNPANTLNPTAPLVAPAVPIAPPLPVVPPVGGDGREAPGVPVDRPKPPDGPFDPTDKFKFPLPPPTSVVPHRDDNMMNITTSAAFAFLGGALLAAEHAKALPVLPSVPGVPLPGSAVRADELEKLKDLDDAAKKLAAANKRIDDLEKQVAKLEELLNGRKQGGFRLESDPGAVEEIKRLKNKIADLEGDIKALKTPPTTVQKPASVPEVRPKGLVKVVNEYPVEISIVINDKSYRVAPNTKLEVEVPAGEFAYQLLQSGAALTKSVIKEKETVTLRIK